MPITSVQNGTRYPFLSIPDQNYTLDIHRVDIWQYSLKAMLPQALSWLNSEELHRAQRYHFERHRRRFIQARACLRLILARYLDCAPQDLTFHTNAYGKPYLNHESQIQFNLSHSGDLALLAIGQYHPLGVDIEFFSGRPFQGMSDMMFSTQEIHQYAQVKPYLRSWAFFHVWAQKEAFIKACGMGLSYPTQSFDVPVLATEDSTIFDSLHTASWQMRSFMPKIACYAALCHHSAVQKLYYRYEP